MDGSVTADLAGCCLCVQGLHDEMAQVDDDLLEADAKNRLYQLLGERTRQEHMALDQKVRWWQAHMLGMCILCKALHAHLETRNRTYCALASG